MKCFAPCFDDYRSIDDPSSSSTSSAAVANCNTPCPSPLLTNTSTLEGTSHIDDPTKTGAKAAAVNIPQTTAEAVGCQCSPIERILVAKRVPIHLFFIVELLMTFLCGALDGVKPDSLAGCRSVSIAALVLNLGYLLVLTACRPCASRFRTLFATANGFLVTLSLALVVASHVAGLQESAEGSNGDDVAGVSSTPAPPMSFQASSPSLQDRLASASAAIAAAAMYVAFLKAVIDLFMMLLEFIVLVKKRIRERYMAAKAKRDARAQRTTFMPALLSADQEHLTIATAEDELVVGVAPDATNAAAALGGSPPAQALPGLSSRHRVLLTDDSESSEDDSDRRRFEAPKGNTAASGGRATLGSGAQSRLLEVDDDPSGLSDLLLSTNGAGAQGPADDATRRPRRSMIIGGYLGECNDADDDIAFNALLRPRGDGQGVAIATSPHTLSSAGNSLPPPANVSDLDKLLRVRSADSRFDFL